ncbi:MATH domain and coiled-coil domain-containing protein-like protein [Salvia divinorum]|uniref:MATH domain and coiled-coil domain-containing protein-like protein n=1 Tax=Salvia divinorum TaxID=28513 RepID=A0ABD1HZD7_SALDI
MQNAMYLFTLRLMILIHWPWGGRLMPSSLSFSTINRLTITPPFEGRQGASTLAKDARDFKIYGFSKLVDMWVSEEFEVEDHIWRLQVYPEGNASQAKGRFVSVYLECVSAKSFDQHQKIKAEVWICIEPKIKTNRNPFIPCKSISEGRGKWRVNRWFRSSVDRCGCNEFMPISEMGNYLNEDCCSLQVEICVQALVS